MDIRKVKKLIELLEESGISEIEIHEGEESVRISRHGAGQPVQAFYHVPEQQQSAPAAGVDTTPARESLSHAEEGHVIKSPMVGTYYSSGTPGNPPFVTVGQKVSEGDVLCIIEAMKIMNQIECDTNGTVTRILAENGDPVEYGQPLFVIKPA
jgi:acetyl-CoA carboxylase biotin carboxyl carrier protein